MSTSVLFFVLVPMLPVVVYLLYPDAGRHARAVRIVALSAMGLGAFGLLLEFVGIGF